MDVELARSMRQIRATGRTVVLVVEMIHAMRDRDRLVVFNTLRFYEERQRRKWSLSINERFPIAQLGDSTILRVIEGNSCRRHHERWLHGAVRRDAYGERTIYALIMEEAEHRGIFSMEQQFWMSVREQPDRLLKRIECCGRTSDWISVDNVHTCTNCRKKITDEEILKRADFNCRLRLTTS
jgi:hypothetical protein